MKFRAGQGAPSGVFMPEFSPRRSSGALAVVFRFSPAFTSIGNDKPAARFHRRHRFWRAVRSPDRQARPSFGCVGVDFFSHGHQGGIGFGPGRDFFRRARVRDGGGSGALQSGPSFPGAASAGAVLRPPVYGPSLWGPRGAAGSRGVRTDSAPPDARGGGDEGGGRDGARRWGRGADWGRPAGARGRVRGGS